MIRYNNLLTIAMLCSFTVAQQLQNQPPQQQQQTQIRFVEIPSDQPFSRQGNSMEPFVVQSSALPQDAQKQPVQRQLTPEEQYRQQVMQVYGSVDDNNLMPLYEPRPISEDALQTQIDMPSQLPQQSYIVDPELQSFYDTFLPNYNQQQGIQQNSVMIQENQLQQGFLDQHLDSNGQIKSNEVEKEVADLSTGVLRDRYIPQPKPKPKIPYPKAPKPQIYYTRQNKDGEEEVVRSQREIEAERRPAPPRPVRVVPNTNFYESANIPGDQNRIINTEQIRYQDRQQPQQQVRGNRRSFPSNLSEDYEGRFNQIQNPIEVPLDFSDNQQQQNSQELTWEQYQQRAYEQEQINQQLLNDQRFQQEPQQKVYTPQFVGQSQQ